MSDVKWIKITTDMFDNRKIKHLRKLPDGDRIVLIWVMLLTLAGRCNSGGMIFLTENIPYTPKLLADELGFEENTVVLALDALEKFEMIRRDGFLLISGWDEYQNTDRLEQIKEQNRLRKQRQRERQRMMLTEGHVTVTGQDRDSHGVDKETGLDKDKEEDIDKRERIDYQQIADMYNEICISFPRIRALSENRKKAIGARLKQYSVDDFRDLFEKAEASKFLKGGNDRNWSATFDWLIADKNMAKVLDGNYDDRGSSDGNNRGTSGKVSGSRWNIVADVG